MSRWARGDERPALAALWQRCFGDGPEVTEAFFRAFPPERHTRVICAEGTLAAMASWVPVTLRLDGARSPGAYVYAVATDPAFRGRGLCRRLMAELEAALRSRGCAFTALCPAEPSLYDFYAALGYETAFYRRTPAAIPACAEPVDSAAYRRLREPLLSEGACLWDDAAFSYLAATGMRFFRLPDGCAALQTLPDGAFRVVERLGAPEVGEAEPQGMWKLLTFGRKSGPFTLGFALD